jgi:hypothetical protein
MPILLPVLAGLGALALMRNPPKRRKRRKSRRNPHKHLPGKMWVQLMESAQRYGGPEEGGWYYEAVSDQIPAHHVAAGSAMNLAKKLAKRHHARLHIQNKTEWPKNRYGGRDHGRFVWIGKSRHRARGHQSYS